MRENNPVSAEFVGAAQAFSYDSAARLLAEGTKNRNYSPLSLYYALALTAQGAEGKTEEEMLAVLGMKDKAELAAQCGNLYRLLYRSHEYSRLKLANSLWTQQGLAFKDGFLGTAQDDFTLRCSRWISPVRRRELPWGSGFPRTQAAFCRLRWRRRPEMCW